MENSEKTCRGLVVVLADKSGFTKVQANNLLDSFAEVLEDELNFGYRFV